MKSSRTDMQTAQKSLKRTPAKDSVLKAFFHLSWCSIRLFWIVHCNLQSLLEKTYCSQTTNGIVIIATNSPEPSCQALKNAINGILIGVFARVLKEERLETICFFLFFTVPLRHSVEDMHSKSLTK